MRIQCAVDLGGVVGHHAITAGVFWSFAVKIRERRKFFVFLVHQLRGALGNRNESSELRTTTKADLPSWPPLHLSNACPGRVEIRHASVPLERM